MFNAENFARPESELSTDGVYVPTAEDWAEANAHWDAQDENCDPDDCYNPFDDPSAWEGDCDDDPVDYYGADHEESQPEWMN